MATRGGYRISLGAGGRVQIRKKKYLVLRFTFLGVADREISNGKYFNPAPTPKKSSGRKVFTALSPEALRRNRGNAIAQGPEGWGHTTLPSTPVSTFGVN